jgi:hypothetical protein
MNLISEKWMELKFEDRRYIGVEDIRIFNDIATNELLFIGTGYHQSNQIGIVTGKYDLENYKTDYNEIRPNFNNSSCEKNWIYVDYNNSIHIIYEWYPLKICKLNNETNILSLIETIKMPKIFSRVRGSTNGFNYNYFKKYQENNNNIDNIKLNIIETEIWFVSHIVSYENPRHYYHLISVFDSDMKLLRYSAPFKFEGESIEYCLSIVVENERIIINYSTWDRTTRIGIYDKKYIDSILKYN